MKQHRTYVTSSLDKKHWFSHCDCEEEPCGYQGGPFDTRGEAEQDGDEHTLEMAKVD